MHQLFGVEPTDGSSVMFVMPAMPIVVVFGSAGLTLVANVVLMFVLSSDVEPSCTVTPV